MRALALTTAGILLVSLTQMGPAAADTPGCVTKGEFSRAKKGMPKKRVHAIFDTTGSQTALGPPEVRQYSPCDAAGVVQVTYRSNGRLKSKSGNWISV